jgi:hypothetical protein
VEARVTNKFGPHGADVAAFLADVEATTDPNIWDQILAGENPSTGVAAMSALTKTRLSASASSAVDRGVRLAYKSLHLTREDLPHAFFGPRDVSNVIGGAAATLAVGDQLAAEHRRTFLGPFADLGFASVLSSYAWTTLDTETPTGPEAADSE